MIEVIKKRSGLQIFAVALTLLISNPGFSSGLTSARIFPTGKINFYNGDQKVGEYSREAPFPEGYLIAPKGKCGVKLEDLYLVAEDKSLFSVDAETNRLKLLVKNGTVYFAISRLSRVLSFITPEGIVDARELIMNAAADNRLLKGYVTVNEGASEIGVVEGGSMAVSTQQGDMIIMSGQRIILAQAEMDIGLPKTRPPAEKKPEPQKKSGIAKGTKIALYVISPAAVIAAGAALGGGGGGGGDTAGSPVSPSSPTP